MIVTQVRFSFCVASLRGLHVDNLDDYPSDVYEVAQHDAFSQYVYIQIFTAQWKTGSRNRTRTVRDVQAYFRYIEKLYNGGYLSAVDFDHAAGMLFVAMHEAKGLFHAHNIACTEVPLADMLSSRVRVLTDANRFVEVPRGMINAALENYHLLEETDNAEGILYV